MAGLRLPGRGRVYASSFAALAIAAVAAGTLSTVAQVALWLLFTDAWPVSLLRDARLAAAIVMGPAVLPPPASFDPVVMGVATVVHFALSFVYAALIAWLVGQRSPGRAVALGAASGLALYLVNMHGFTLVFPWFAQARDWITLAAHVAFGVVAAAAWVQARPRRVA
ncbi:MAG TPA: sodium:proline symporter [Burkholderiaceae bacterium]|nr:sodium:proline symporter [Burkholderiaceae bacterium]